MLAVEIEPMFAEEAEKRKLAQLKRGTVFPVVPDLAQREIEPKEAKKSRTKAGQIFGVGHSSVSKAKKVAKTKPEKVKDIIAGKTSLACTYVEGKRGRDRADVCRRS